MDLLNQLRNAAIHLKPIKGETIIACIKEIVRLTEELEKTKRELQILKPSTEVNKCDLSEN